MRVFQFKSERFPNANASIHKKSLLHNVLILDGGLSTEIENYDGIRLSEGCLWSARLLLPQNAHLQQAIVHAHSNYFRSGAEIATTSSYQVSLDGLLREFKGDIGTAQPLLLPMLNKSIELASIARDTQYRIQDNSNKPMIAASIGCFGAALADGSEYRGQYTLNVDQLVSWHLDRFRALALHPQTDILIFETIPCIIEVEAIVRLLNSHSEMIQKRQLKVIIAVACRNESQLNSGEPIFKLTETIQSIRCQENLIGIGINCTNPKFVESLLKSFSCSCDKIVYPNSGEEWNANAKQWERPNGTQSATACLTDWETYLPRWYDAGARIFGGCCRTSPKDIAAIRNYFTNTPNQMN
uniref:Uncharacterized protein ALNC14_086560 n=1 Tax=Albugo laibachii Nc14 TaxID=890382 RepID=F0WMI1_9STRA|nr:unnamed protein product [Albugo laibachii Nc14]|eukprot:CCA22513.1 unnamed protein product [Albugo laibachii Nc14]